VRIIAAVVLELLLIVAGSGGADKVPSPNIDARNEKSAVELKAILESRARKGGGSPPGRVVRRGAPLPRARLLLPACTGNELSGGVPRDALCAQALDLCAGTPDPTDRMFWIYLGPPGVARPGPADWTRSGQVCLPTPTAAVAPRPVVTAEDFRRLPLPAGQVHIQPGSGRTLLNVPTNVYVEAGVVVLPTTVLGQPVRVRATPVEYTWGFGDGAGLRTSDPGAPYPDLRTTHTYTVPGTMRLTLTTVYRGEYSVAAGAWTPIAGTAAVDSPAQALTVVAARARLVEDTLPAN
jgi:hypothetical protein